MRCVCARFVQYYCTRLCILIRRHEVAPLELFTWVSCLYIFFQFPCSFEETSCCSCEMSRMWRLMCENCCKSGWESWRRGYRVFNWNPAAVLKFGVSPLFCFCFALAPPTFKATIHTIMKMILDQILALKCIPVHNVIMCVLYIMCTGLFV